MSFFNRPAVEGPRGFASSTVPQRLNFIGGSATPVSLLMSMSLIPVAGEGIETGENVAERCTAPTLVVGRGNVTQNPSPPVVDRISSTP